MGRSHRLGSVEIAVNHLKVDLTTTPQAQAHVARSSERRLPPFQTCLGPQCWDDGLSCLLHLRTLLCLTPLLGHLGTAEGSSSHRQTIVITSAWRPFQSKTPPNRVIWTYTKSRRLVGFAPVGSATQKCHWNRRSHSLHSTYVLSLGFVRRYIEVADTVAYLALSAVS